MRASDPHRSALLGALETVYGLAGAESHRISAAGKTDTEIAREIALACGLEEQEFDSRVPELVKATVERFRTVCPPSLLSHLGAGVAELLDSLSIAGTHQLSLLTGNYEQVARIKLERAGIGHHFPAGQGAFGSDAEQRALLGPIARARAGSASAPYPRERTTIIGDTPLDIACARADGLGVIAIATGPYAAEALTEADAVVPDAHALQALLQPASE